ncbi:MAG: fructokinase [Hyphococcus sp.]|nr:MAG: fructokinase [Marinicaulis sp.]
MKIGIDWGGTKIEAAMLNDTGEIIWRKRLPTPQGDYQSCLEVVRGLVSEIETKESIKASVGIGIPGSVSPVDARVRNANSEWLNGQLLEQDITKLLDRPVRIANDANCFAVSEAVDGAGAGAHCVFGVIIGTGVGGGIAFDGKPHEGRTKIAGEWGHTPLPLSRDDPSPYHPCWCGRLGCVETYLSGRAFAQEHLKAFGQDINAETIIDKMRDGDQSAKTSFDLYTKRFARALSVIINIVDPDVIVLGGGMSNVSELYEVLPQEIDAHIFSDVFYTPIRQAVHGDSSGVRGAAHLW